ncbi:MAG: helix-turn-helix domain-containing protein [Chitinophagaceae bacterium]|jgi:antitoxin component HigA of HigAB toxin-antitoxin module|nr:MAG: helix-turn-helix domain-containing protein [Chitinophagaceae bacterium]
MKIAITSKKEYHKMMIEIYNLMDKGGSNLTKLELKKMSKMSIAAELYEDNVLGLKPKKEPETIPELVELKLFENKMTQAKLAEEIGLAKSKVSEILNGKRKADIPFLKGIHKVLKIDAGVLLEIA